MKRAVITVADESGHDNRTDDRRLTVFRAALSAETLPLGWPRHGRTPRPRTQIWITDLARGSVSRLSTAPQQNANGVWSRRATQVPTIVRRGVLANTRILSPSIVNDARFNWNQFSNFYTAYYAYKTNVQATLDIQGLVAPDPSAYGLPALSNGFSNAGGATPWVTHNDAFQWIDGVSILKGKHSIKVGGEIRRMRYNQFGNQKTAGEFDFNGGSTCNPANCTSSTGYAYADFLLEGVFFKGCARWQPHHGIVLAVKSSVLARSSDGMI